MVLILNNEGCIKERKKERKKQQQQQQFICVQEEQNVQYVRGLLVDNYRVTYCYLLG